MSLSYYVIYLLIIAGTTYFIRVIPFALVKRQLKNRHIRAFLNYIPYAVLAAMTYPAILYSTTYFFGALCGCLIAMILSYFRQSMVKVAISSCLTVYIVESMIRTFLS